MEDIPSNWSTIPTKESVEKRREQFSYWEEVKVFWANNLHKKIFQLKTMWKMIIFGQNFSTLKMLKGARGENTLNLLWLSVYSAYKMEMLVLSKDSTSTKQYLMFIIINYVQQPWADKRSHWGDHRPAAREGAKSSGKKARRKNK